MKKSRKEDEHQNRTKTKIQKMPTPYRSKIGHRNQNDGQKNDRMVAADGGMLFLSLEKLSKVQNTIRKMEGKGSPIKKVKRQERSQNVS